jgi:4-phytase/acid phosphatase
MRIRIFSAVLLAVLAVAPVAVAAPNLQLERVVLLMRHGVRPPTHEPALPVSIAPYAWPAWAVAPGFLTPHGAQAIQLLGAYERDALAAQDLLPQAGCPAAGDVLIYADVDERTVKTGEAFAAGFAPGCAIAVGHAAGKKDPLFSALDAPVPGFDADKAGKAMLVAAGGNFNAPMRVNAALFAKMQNALAPGGDGFLKLKVVLEMKDPHKLPSLSGPLDEGSSAGEDFLLEYLDGKPMAQVGWGRVNAADVSALLALHPLAYTVTARPAYIADYLAAPLAKRIVAALAAQGDAPKLTVLVGHDTNIAALGGMLGLHWALGGYPADDPPPGGGLGFALYLDKATGLKYVKVFYQVQSMAQIRGLVPLSLDNPPAVQDLPVPGCAVPCGLPAFNALVARGAAGGAAAD